MSTPSTIAEVLAAVSLRRQEARVIEYLIEQLRPFMEMDTKRKRNLEAEGCMVPFVESSVIVGRIRWLSAELQRLEKEVEVLENSRVATAPAPTPAVGLPPAPVVSASPAAATSRPRRRRTT